MIDTLTSAINRDKSQEELICLGMLTVVLTEPPNAEKVYSFFFLFLFFSPVSFLFSEIQNNSFVVFSAVYHGY